MAKQVQTRASIERIGAFLMGRGGFGVGDDTIVRLFSKLDNISERLARMETMFEEHKRYTGMIEEDISALQRSIAEHGKRVGDLEQARAGAMSIKEFVGWGVAVVAAIWAVMK